MVVGGKQSLAAKALGGVCNVLHYGAGNAHTVKGGSAAADLVQHHKAFGGGIFQDLRYLGHLHHKGGLTGRQVVRRTDASENGIHHTHMAAGSRYKGADLRHQRNQCILAHVRRFTCHVGAGDDQAAVCTAVQGGIIGYKQAAFQHLLHHRVTALGDGQLVTVVHDGTAVVVFRCHLRQRREHIQLGHRIGRALDAVQLSADTFQQFAEQAVLQRDEPFVGT